MTMIVYVLATSMSGMMDTEIYQCDVVAELRGQPKDLAFVEYLSGVTETEYIYQKMDYVYFGDETFEKTAQVFGVPDGGYEMYRALTGLPEVIENGTIYIDKGWGNNNGYSVGDTLKITFNPAGVFPIIREYTVAGYFKLDSYEAIKNNFVISQDDFISVFHNNPGYLMVRCDKPEKTRDEILRYGVGNVSTVRTKQEIIEDFEDDNAQSNRIYNIVIIVAVVMTCIGMISNQLLGFEGRKKECAVMISTSMSKKTLSGILFREMLITSLTAATSGCLLASLLLLVLKKAFTAAETLALTMEFNPGTMVKFWILLTIVFTMTVLFPIKNIRKMKLSEQLKYE